MRQFILTFLLVLLSFISFSQKLNKEYGLMIIDVQKFFIPNHKESIYKEYGMEHPLQSGDIISNLKKVIDWGNQNKLKTFVTFEGSDSGRFNLPDELLPLLPKEKTSHYIKTSFNALQHNDFKEKVLASGIKKWIVAGAETDVCIYQTAIGLRKLGFEVFLVKEAVYSGRVNTDNALFNLQKYGVNFVSSNDLSKIKSIQAPQKAKSVPDKLQAENLVLVVIEPEESSAASTPEQIRLNEVKKFAKALSIPIEQYRSEYVPLTLPVKTILLAGYLTNSQYEQVISITEGNVIVLSDCIPDKQFNTLDQSWNMITYKMLFYDILGNVDEKDSSTLRNAMKNKNINWPDYTQN